MTTSFSTHYVAIGDSLVEGYTDWGVSDAGIGFAHVLAAMIRATQPHSRFTNLGVSGARAADVLRVQVTPAIALEPTLLTLVVGANDIPVTPADEFRHTYDELVGQIASKVDGLVLVSNIPNLVHLLPVPFAGYRVLLEERLRTFNEVIAEVTTKHGVRLVDLFDGRETEDPRNIGADGFHPSIRGYRVMAQSFVQVLQQTGWELPPLLVD